jgi:N-acetylneuraminate synthase
VAALREFTDDIVLMQCNTNYTGSHDNFANISLNVLRSYEALFPGMVLGLSDHTPGHATALGAVALGARVIEKHFTDDTTREGPDHGFSMDPRTWSEMVDRVRELESALGSPLKIVESNESETVVIQRRGIRIARDLPANALLTRGDLTVLRPCPAGVLPASALGDVIGRRLRRAMMADEAVGHDDVVYG